MAKYKIGQRCKINDSTLKSWHNLHHGQEVIIDGIFSSPNWRLDKSYEDVYYYEVLDVHGKLVIDKYGKGGVVRVPEKYLVPLTNPKQWTVQDTKNFLLDMTKQAALNLKTQLTKIKETEK